MKLRIVSACLALVLVLSLCSGFTAFAAQGELPETLTLRAAEGNGIPSWIDLTPDPAGTKDAYHLYLPGNVVPEACFLSWEGGLSATLEGKSYESGALPIPKPGQSATYSFTAGAQSKTFTVRCYQGSAAVKPIFIEIDESLGTIAAMNGDKDHETTCSGIIYVDGVQMTLSKMKGRGNYTWDHAVEKRPYNITLGKKTVLLGIDTPQTKKWSLLANTNDHTLLRNKVAYDLAHTMGIGQDSATADMWMNGQYIQKMGAKEWVELSRPWLARAHAEGYPYVYTAIVPTLDPNAPADAEEVEPLNEEQLAAFEDSYAADPAFYEALYPLVSERETSLTECESKLAYMFWGPCVLLDEKSVNKILRKDGARADEALAACREVLADEGNEWKAEVLEEKCRALAEPLEMKLRNLLQPLRVAICGNMVSPPLFESIELLKRSDVLARIDATIAEVF